MSAVDRVQNITCSRVIPEYYEGIREMEAVAEGSDHILSMLRKTVTDIDLDRYIQTATETIIRVWEDGLDITPQGSLDERRQAIHDYVNRSRILSDKALHRICQSIVGQDNPLTLRTDSKNLTLSISTEFENPDGSIPAIEVVQQTLPIIPANLDVFAAVSASKRHEVTVKYGHTCAVSTSLGLVSYVFPRENVLLGFMSTAGAVEDDPNRSIRKIPFGIVNRGSRKLEVRASTYNPGQAPFGTVNKGSRKLEVRASTYNPGQVPFGTVNYIATP